MTVTYSVPFQPKPDTGFRLEDARTVWDAIVNSNGISQASGIAAAGTTRATATPLTAVINQVDTVASSTGVNLPLSTGLRTSPYSFCLIINNGANTLTVYGAQTGSDTIDGVSGTTGVSQTAGSTVLYVSAKAGAWFALGSGSNASFGALTATTFNGNTLSTGSGNIARTTGSDLFVADITRCTTQLDATTNTTLANITGMVQTVVPGTYRIKIHLAGTAGASGGWKVAFKLTTTAITSWNMTGYGYAAGTVGVQDTTTTTDQTSLIARTAANIAGIIEGTAVIGTGGTMQLQFAQNVSDGTTCSIYVGSYMEFTQIA